jgi:hypothetical protein
MVGKIIFAGLLLASGLCSVVALAADTKRWEPVACQRLGEVVASVRHDLSWSTELRYVALDPLLTSMYQHCGANVAGEIAGNAKWLVDFYSRRERANAAEAPQEQPSGPIICDTTRTSRRESSTFCY